MRHLLLCCVPLLLACGGSHDAAAPQMGTLSFKLDPVTCTGTGTIEPFIDGTSQGQFTFSPGVAQGFSVRAGSHTAGAREVPVTSGSYVWQSQTVSVPANGTYTTLLTC